MTINTTNQSSFLTGIINDVHNRLREVLGDFNEQSIAFHVNRLWNTLLTGEDFRATTSSETNDNETASDTLSIKIDIVALSCLIMADHSTVINGLYLWNGSIAIELSMRSNGWFRFFAKNSLSTMYSSG
jgi:hypothetical protein